MDYIRVIWLAAGCCTFSALIPQYAEWRKRKKAARLSMKMLYILLAANSFWIWYGFMTAEVSVVSVNLFALTLNVVTIGLRSAYAYRRV
jgi:uncharacterized protein with PQ loop repeat